MVLVWNDLCMLINIILGPLFNQSFWLKWWNQFRQTSYCWVTRLKCVFLHSSETIQHRTKAYTLCFDDEFIGDFDSRSTVNWKAPCDVITLHLVHTHVCGSGFQYKWLNKMSFFLRYIRFESITSRRWMCYSDRSCFWLKRMYGWIRKNLNSN